MDSVRIHDLFQILRRDHRGRPPQSHRVRWQCSCILDYLQVTKSAEGLAQWTRCEKHAASQTEPRLADMINWRIR